MLIAADTLNPPIQYDLIWTVIGIMILLAVASWVYVAFWLTRPKVLKTIADLKQLPTGGELPALKAKYLKLVEDSYQLYLRKEIGLRRLHKNLSVIIRYFVYEARHFPAPVLTLSDLRRGPYPTLAVVVGIYYPEEFAALERGNAAKSVEAAKGLILQWV